MTLALFAMTDIPTDARVSCLRIDDLPAADKVASISPADGLSV